MHKALTFDDVLLVPAYNDIPTRNNVDTSTTIGHKLKIPIISSNMDTISGWRMAQEMARLGGLGILHRFDTIEQSVEEYRRAIFQKTCPPVGVSVGVNEHEQKRAEALIDAGAYIICVDAAHGHAKNVGLMVYYLKQHYPFTFIIAGNVCSYAGADYLSSMGADCIKIGIGAGGACSTRIKTGFGYPQFSAILECRRVSKPIIADGGIRTPGDAVKALAAGADAIMIGSLLAGTDETPGETFYKGNIKGNIEYKRFRGMASKEAYEGFTGVAFPEWKTGEGISTDVPTKGPAEAVIRDIMGGIRSGMTYCGATTLEDFKRRVTYVEVTAAGHTEGRPHILDRL